jgi:CDP-glucose 4,6-dehydratase
VDPALSPESRRSPSREFWSGRRVLVTGHTGFKGSWLTLWLSMLGATIQGLSLPTAGEREAHWEALGVPIDDDVRTDIDGTDWQDRVREFAPNVIVHLAAQSLVSVGHAAPLETFATNVMGTARVLQFTAEADDVSAVLVATTDKVYDPRQQLPYAEDAYLGGGADPYSASKAAAELVLQAWPPTGAAVVAARAGNVIGGGDWSPQRLVPDLVRAWAAGQEVSIREPHAVRPWQHVLEPLAGYLLYVEAAVGTADVPRALNFGPADQQRVPVSEVVRVASRAWSQALGQAVEPGFISAPESERMNEVPELLIDSRRAHESLGWASRLGWEDAVRMAIDWYARAAAGTPPAELSRRQIEEYVERVTG